MIFLIRYISLDDNENAKTLFKSLDSYKDSSLLDKFYLGSIYDLLVAKSKFVALKTDFVYVNNKEGEFKNFLNSTSSKPNYNFSYSNVALAL